jgi:hypothetical protein
MHLDVTYGVVHRNHTFFHNILMCNKTNVIIIIHFFFNCMKKYDATNIITKLMFCALHFSTFHPLPHTSMSTITNITMNIYF